MASGNSELMRNNNNHRERQRKLLYLFPPFLPNELLSFHERLRIAFGMLWMTSMMVILILSVQQLTGWWHNPIFFVFAAVCTFRFAHILHRYFFQWGTAKRFRWNYWHEIEISNSSVKLQLLGHYHLQIAKYLDCFPAGTPGTSVKSYYRVRSVANLVLFSTIYLICVIYLAIHPYETNGATIVLFCASAGCAAMMHKVMVNFMIELPQALHLSRRPEFATDLNFGSHESLPIARPVAIYSK